ncbi:MAG: hypothetical protein HN350_15190 [Phycisphaerales bacterium]|jgi:hypothetical protein|nr:hypothetical protein [Phycisphaerales bacterium]
MTQRQENPSCSKGDSLRSAGNGWPDDSARAYDASGIPQDELGKEIETLKALHPDLQLEFRDLNSLDRTGKLLLLEQMRDMLGIRKPARSAI